MNKERCDAIRDRWAEAHATIHVAYTAVNDISSALGLPFRPIRLQPIADLWALVGDTMSLLRDLTEQNSKLRDSLAQAEAALRAKSTS